MKGSSMGDTPATTCTCGRPTRDAAYACDDCTADLSRVLGEVPWVSDELDTTITRQKAVTYNGGGGRGAETPSPVHWGASQARSNLRAALVTWVRWCEEEQVRNASPHDGLPADNLPAMSRWLMWRVDGLALLDIGPEAVEQITSAVAHCHRVIDRPADRWYAGPCNAETGDRECGADLYAKSARGVVECATCGATYDVGERRTWLLAAAEDRLADAATLARSVSWLGAKPLNADRVRKWAQRGRIVAKGHDEKGRALYRIGDAIEELARDANRSGAA